MDSFAQAVDQWHDFYLMVGTAAATLIGLLFVGLSLNIEMMRRKDVIHLQVLAVETFNSFFYVLLFAIIFLIPEQTSSRLGFALLAIGALGSFNILNQLRRIRGVRNLIGRFALTSVALVGVVISALAVLAGQTDGFYWLVPVMLFLLASASRNAWDILIGMRETPSDAGKKDNP